MTITHAISTERLVNVLQGIALKQQTGCLSVQCVHKQGHIQEEEKGNIFFERGDTVIALTGQESGETALFRMLNWKNASYIFTEGVRYIPERAATSTTASFALDMQRLSSMKAAENRQTPPIGIPAIPKTVQRQLPADMAETLIMPAIKPTAVSLPTPSLTELPVTPYVQRAVFSQWNTGQHEQVAVSEGHERHESHAMQMGVTSIFRAHPLATNAAILYRLERRERVVLLLMNGKRTVRDVAALIHQDEVEVARTLVHLLKRGYIEHMGAK